MSAFPPEFVAHLAQDCTTVCHCWKLTRRDGTVMGFTDHDRQLVVDGVTFQPQSGFSQTEARASLGMAIDTADVEGALSSDVLDEADILAGQYDGARVETFLVNWMDVAQFASIRVATIGKIERVDGRFVAELESLSASLDKPNGRVLRRQCDARLGDGRCKVNTSASNYRGEGEVSQVTGAATIVVSGLSAFAAGWFSDGEIVWQSGQLEGLRVPVMGHVVRGTTVELTLSAAEALPEIGTSFVITAGCDKQFATCRQKFANGINFRGFPHLPGNDAAYGYVSDGMLFDGGALVK